jgi:hypothetical protein
LRITPPGRIVVLHATIESVSAQGDADMFPSRRQFVASIAAAPFLAQSAGAQRRPSSSPPDPVLDQILTDLRELSAEFESQPRSRKATMRAMESTLGIGAAHLAAHYDANLQATVRRRQARQGRSALVQEIVNQAHDSRNHTVSHDAVEAAMTRLQQQGLSGAFRDIQQTIRRIRLAAPEQVQAAAAGAVQFDYCADLNWMISNLEGIVAIVCAIAVLEPTLAGEIPCAALTLGLGILLVQRAWFC